MFHKVPARNRAGILYESKLSNLLTSLMTIPMTIMMTFVTKRVQNDDICDESDEERFVTTFVQQSAKVASDCLDLIRIQSLTPVDKQNLGEGWRRELPRWEL